MEKIIINWSSKQYNFTKRSELRDLDEDFLDENGFYHIFAIKYDEMKEKYVYSDKLYIGVAYEQPLRTRISQPHSAYTQINKYLKDHPDRSVKISVGWISYSTSERRTKELYYDIENALIYNSRPLYNEQKIEKYDGRTIEIRNAGKYKPLSEFICYESE